MKSLLLVILFILSCNILMLAQEKHADSLNNIIKMDISSNKLRLDSLLHKESKVDFVVHNLVSKINSVNSFELSSLVQTLLHTDAITAKGDTATQHRGTKNLKKDSLLKRQINFDSLNYKKKKADVIAVAHRFNSKVDSLSHLQVSSLLRQRKLLDDSTKTKQDTANKHGRKLLNSDSLKERYTKSLTTVNSVPDSIQRKLNAKAKTAQERIDSTTGFLDSLQLNIKNSISDKSTNYSINGIKTILSSKDINVKDLDGDEMKVPFCSRTSQYFKYCRTNFCLRGVSPRTLAVG